MTTATISPPATTHNSVALRGLIAEVRAIVRSVSDSTRVGEMVAALLPRYLCLPDLLTTDQLVPDKTKYRQHILHVEPDGAFSVVALVWLPGQATPIHDHVSWCVVGVHRGEEHETVYHVGGTEVDPHLLVASRHVNPVGSVAALLPPGDIHHVANDGDCLAVSLHIYGADIGTLGSSIRRRYDLEIRASQCG